MASVDNGGLNWKIVVEDQFTAPLSKFVAQATAAKAALDAFRADKGAFTSSIDQLRALTELTKAQTAAAREARQTQAQADRDAAREARGRTQAANEEKAQIRNAIALIRELQRERAAAARQLDAENKTRAAVAKEQERLNAATKTAAGGTTTLTDKFKNLRAALLGGAESGNRLVFTLRNIIGVGAGLVFIQKIQQGFSGLVRSGIDFNAQVENSEVGIAGLLTAVLDIKDAQGNIVTGARAFADTFDIAQVQVEKLRQATLRTTATFEQLADTFQIAVAPGLKAGLNIDQIRELAVSISQAAGALGVPTNQLSEEIRALLTGTIQARTTRIATALGITPDDIRRAKADVGGLAKFLDDRFRAFEIAGERAAGTFTGTFNRAKVAISLVAGDASKDLFEEIRTTFLTVFDTLTTRDSLGNLLPSSDAVGVLERLFEGMADAVKTVRTNLQSISLRDLQTSAEAIGGVFRVMAQILSGFIQGAINGFSTLARIFKAVFGDNADLTKMATRLGEIITVAGVIGTAFGGLRAVIGTLLLPLTSVIKTVEILGTTAKAIGLTNPFVLASAAAFALGYQIGALIKLYQDLDKVRIGATPEAQLSKQTIIAQKIRDLTAERLKIIDEGNKAEAEGDIRKANRATQVQLQIIKEIEAQKKLLALQIEADKKNPKGAFNPQANFTPPSLADTDFLASIKGFAANIQAALSAALGDEPPVNVPIAFSEDDLLKEMADLEERAKRSGDRLTPKIQLNRFGEELVKMGDVLQGELDLMRSAVTEFSSFVADSIVDAFDPTNDTSFQERFAQFLQSIAKQIIATLVQIGIAKALLSFGVGTASEGGLAVSGLAAGGRVRQKGFAEGGPILSPAHYGIKAPPPPGLDPTDTIPAWLAPNEYVVRAKSTAKYGADFLEMLNRGLLDPSALRATAGLLNKRSSVKSIARVSGFADGGLIADRVAAATQSAQTATSAPSGGPTPAYIVGNDLAVDRLLAGGQGAFLRFISENSDQIDGILSKNRR